MKIISKPQYAITPKEVDRLLTLKNQPNPICDNLDCSDCQNGCDDCPFNAVSDKLQDILNEAAEIAKSLPRASENEGE